MASIVTNLVGKFVHRAGEKGLGYEVVGAYVSVGVPILLLMSVSGVMLTEFAVKCVGQPRQEV